MIRIAVCIGMLFVLVSHSASMMLPIDSVDVSPSGVVCVAMHPLKGKNDVPSFVEAFPFQKKMLGITVVHPLFFRTDYCLEIHNRSDVPYRFGAEYSGLGYDSLELDFLLSDGAVVKARKRSPNLIHTDIRVDTFTLMPGWKWRSPISLERRIWEGLPPLDQTIVKVRPRFAFGAYEVEGSFYRTREEAAQRKNVPRKWNDREGELVGEWLSVSTNRPPFASWQSSFH